MGRAEGVVNIDVGQLCQRVGHLGVVRLLLREEADVLQQDDFARFQRFRRLHRLRSDDVIKRVHRRAQQLAQTVADAHARHPQLLDDLSVRPPEVRAEHDPRAMLAKVLNGRQRSAQAAIVEDAARLLVEGHVEVDTHQHALTLDVDVTDCHLVHRFPPSGRSRLSIDEIVRQKLQVAPPLRHEVDAFQTS